MSLEREGLRFIDYVSGYPIEIVSMHPASAPTFTNQPGDMYQPDKCRHPKGEACEYCCHQCNYGQHICPDCNASIHHNESMCADCRANESAVTQEIPR